MTNDQIFATADALCALYPKPFGGKTSGRYRIPEKLLRRIAGQRRLYENDIRALTRAMFEKGYIMIDMDSFFVVLSAGTFTNYRRVNEDVLS